MGKQGEKIDGKQKRLDGDTEKMESSRKVIFMINKPEMSKEIIKCIKKESSEQIKKKIKGIEEDRKVIYGIFRKIWENRFRETEKNRISVI